MCIRDRSGTTGSTTAIAANGNATITNSYGQLTMYSTGQYSFVANGVASEQLATGEQAISQFTYTVSDGVVSRTQVLSLTITGTNDTPTITNVQGTTDVTGAVTEDVPLFTVGQSVIDLGSYGQLIAPVQVEGNWYYT